MDILRAPGQGKPFPRKRRERTKKIPSSREDGKLKIRDRMEEEGSREQFCAICQTYGHERAPVLCAHELVFSCTFECCIILLIGYLCVSGYRSRCEQA